MTLFVFGCALMMAYVSSISGAGTSPRWAVAALGCILLVPLTITVTLGHIVAVAFGLWACASMLWSVSPADTTDALMKLVVLLCLFFLGSALRDLRWLYIGAAIGIWGSSALVILDRLGLIAYEQAVRSSGLFVNGLYLAEAAAMVLVACAQLRLWWLVAMVAPSILLVQPPRGPLIALVVAGLLRAWFSSKRHMVREWGLVIGMAGVVVAVWAISWRPETIEVRGRLWLDALGGLSWLGTGWGTYAAAAPFFSSWVDLLAIRPTHPHNDLLEIAVTLGLPGVALAGWFVALLLVPLHGNAGAWRSPERLVIVVFLVEGCFGFPLSMPATACLFAVVAGRAAADRDPVGAPAYASRVSAGQGPRG